MAVRVLRQAKPTREVFRGTCWPCGTEVEADRGDGKVVSDWRDGDYLKVRCPTCGRDIACGRKLIDLEASA